MISIIDTIMNMNKSVIMGMITFLFIPLFTGFLQIRWLRTAAHHIRGFLGSLSTDPAFVLFYLVLFNHRFWGNPVNKRMNMILFTIMIMNKNKIIIIIMILSILVRMNMIIIVIVIMIMNFAHLCSWATRSSNAVRIHITRLKRGPISDANCLGEITILHVAVDWRWKN